MNQMVRTEIQTVQVTKHVPPFIYLDGYLPHPPSANYYKDLLVRSKKNVIQNISIFI